MEPLTALLDWSRAQFALTACYHWLFVPLTLGLAVIMGIMETIYVVKGGEVWKRTAQFWMKLFGINFAIGVATGLILEFEFGTNWSNYSWFVGDIFGAPLAIEGIFAFFMESTFIAVMFFGWNKVGRKFHLASTWLTGLGATISAWWILVANAWMQHPVGMRFNPETVRNEMVSFSDVALSGAAVTKFVHTVTSSWMVGAVFAVGVSCWFLLRKRNQQLALRSIRVAALVGISATILTIITGDVSGVEMAKHQPMKLAAAEGLEKGGTRAAFSIVPGVEVPGVLSILATHDIDGFVPGMQDIINGYTTPDGQKVMGAAEKMARGKKALADFTTFRSKMKTDSVGAQVARDSLMKNVDYFGYGYINDKAELIPPVGLVFWSFRVMVGLGMALMLVLILVWWFERRGTLTKKTWLHRIGVWSIPAVFIASQAGWIVAELGRQPWAIQDLLPVSAALSDLSVGSVMTTFFLFLVIFTVLLIAEISIMTKAVRTQEEIPD